MELSKADLRVELTASNLADLRVASMADQLADKWALLKVEQLVDLKVDKRDFVLAAQKVASLAVQMEQLMAVWSAELKGKMKVW